VFTEEPLRGDHPFLRQPSITLTPHISAVTNRHLSVEQIAQKIKRFEAGAAIDGVVERTRGY
jgi:glyoxylate/hydroxypyruvate reductase A